jgi:hypothetical protein
MSLLKSSDPLRDWAHVLGPVKPPPIVVCVLVKSQRDNPPPILRWEPVEGAEPKPFLVLVALDPHLLEQLVVGLPGLLQVLEGQGAVDGRDVGDRCAAVKHRYRHVLEVDGLGNIAFLSAAPGALWVLLACTPTPVPDRTPSEQLEMLVFTILSFWAVPSDADRSLLLLVLDGWLNKAQFEI